MARNDGKVLEKALQDALADYQKRHRAKWHRFYDTHSARSILPQQPGDFMLLVPGASILIEAKSTDDGTPLLDMIRSSKSGRTQIAEHRIWHRAGHPSVYIWGDLRTKEALVYDGPQVVAAYLNRAQVAPVLEGVIGGVMTLLDALVLRAQGA